MEAQIARTRSKFPLRNSRNPARTAGGMKKGGRRGRKGRKKREGNVEFDRRRNCRSLRNVEGMRSFLPVSCVRVAKWRLMLFAEKDSRWNRMLRRPD